MVSILSTHGKKNSPSPRNTTHSTPPGTITTGNHRHQINQPPQNPGLDTELVTHALDGYLITAEEVAPGCDYVLDGTLMPCWSWKAHPELWSGKHKRTGLNIQVLVTPAGRLVWVSDPCPGSTHDAAALDASGLLEGLDVSGWVADKGYIGRGMITPPRKPAGKQLSDTAKKVSRSINRVRYIVEQVNAHIKTWKILKEDYRRPLNTFPQTITATLMLYTYTTTP